MGRFGLLKDNFAAEILAIKALPNLEVEGIYSHFPCAGTSGEAGTVQQIEDTDVSDAPKPQDIIDDEAKLEHDDVDWDNKQFPQLSQKEYDQIYQDYLDERESQLDYWAEEVTEKEYLIGIGELDEEDE